MNKPKKRGRPPGSKNKTKKPAVKKELTTAQQNTKQDIMLAKDENKKGKKLPKVEKSKKKIGRYLTCPGCDATMVLYFDENIKVGYSKTIILTCEKCKQEHKLRVSVKLLLQDVS